MSDVESELNRILTSRPTKLDGQIDLTDNTRETEDDDDARRQYQDDDGDDVDLTKTRTGTWKSGTGKLRQELARRKYAKYAGPKDSTDIEGEPSRSGSQLGDAGPDDSKTAHKREELTRTVTTPHNLRRAQQKVKGIFRGRKGQTLSDEDFVIEVLFENQRGVWLFGIPYYSSDSLLNFDPAKWTDVSNRPSAVDVTNAQLPDPSWQWTWPRWYVDMSLDVDEQGWQYSYMFQDRFSWHGTHPWFHSFVRRRRWIRKRVRNSTAMKDDTFETSRNSKAAAHTRSLGAEYFSVRAGQAGGPVPSFVESSVTSQQGPIQQRGHDEDAPENIQDLLKKLKQTTLDREKVALVLQYVDHAGEDLHYMADEMSHILDMLVFQHSRRRLLERLVKKLDEWEDAEKENDDATNTSKGKQPSTTNETTDGDLERRRTEYLKNAVHMADKELRKLEFWSDLVDIAHAGSGMGTAEAITEPPEPVKTN
jgi:hypothetical protein